MSGLPKKVETVQQLLLEASGQAAATFAVATRGQLARARVVLSLARLQTGGLDPQDAAVAAAAALKKRGPTQVWKFNGASTVEGCEWVASVMAVPDDETVDLQDRTIGLLDMLHNRGPPATSRRSA